MGKKAKIGKARKDKFYQLAKETGYRARSAFKLLQLNRKFEFLQKSRVCVDLCAAPGGWLQVAAQHTPVSSLIIGIDLVPIKPVHQNVTTFIGDITTEKCRQDLKKELKTWKADCVLHDGAPNVGKNWIQDAYSQAELTLQALKLATEFLRKGGWFVTKVFRSQDYHALLWVFKQLFKKVHATKPQASRLESAEIFVVCQQFVAPDKLDPKFVDPKYVFKQIDTGPGNTLNLIHPEKIKKRAEGYAEGEISLHHTLNASDFIRANNHLELLADTHEIILDDPCVAKHELTTDEIKECCKDVKVLGKKEIRTLITWRKNLKKALRTYKEEEDGEEEESLIEAQTDEPGQADDASDDEENALDKQLAELKSEEVKALKRKIKKVRKEKAKLQQKMSMSMVIPGDRLEVSDDINLFDLNQIKKKEQQACVDKGEMLDESSDDEEIDGALIRKRKLTTGYSRDDSSHLEFESDDGGGDNSDDDEDHDSDKEAGFGDESDDDDEEGNDENSDEDSGDEGGDEKSNPLLVDLEEKDLKAKRKTEMWFEKDVFADLENDADEDLEIETMTEDYVKKGGSIQGKSKAKDRRSQLEESKANKVKDVTTSNSNNSDSGHASESSDETDSDSDSDAANDLDARDVMTGQKGVKKSKLGQKKDGFEIVPAGTSGLKKTKLDAESLAIGAAMASSRKRRRDIIDEGFNRYTFNDENLPEWFTKEETKFMRRNLPVTKEEVEEYKDRMKAINARPIKKVAEAKGRKKRKAAKRLERARKKAEVISDAVDVTDKEKMQQIRQIYKKAGLMKEKKPEVQYVVAKRASGKRVSRPAGVKGRFRVVDPRMKKDNMREKRNLKSGKKGKRKGR